MKRSGIKRKPPRPRPGKDFPKHLAWIRTHQCLVRSVRCAGPTDAHHLKTGYGTSKAPDCETVSLCRHHHWQLHDHYGSERRFEVAHNLDLGGEARVLWRRSPANPENQ